jgi:DNA-directed RNA polymerase I subunit RPA2
MERDSLLSHGAAFLLQDRLLNCSDRHVAYACSRCGDLLMPTTERSSVQSTGQSSRDIANKPRLLLYCRSLQCRKATNREDANDEAVEPIVLPYVYRYLVNELAGMNVKMKLEIK